jgi:hypothetical protein
MKSIETLIDWITEEAKRRSLWVFLEQMSSENNRYHTGYLQALEDVLKVLNGGGENECQK